MSKPLPKHLKEVEILQNAYGAGVVAKLLGITDRAIEKWFEEPNRSPRAGTLGTLSELFERHCKGENLAKNALSEDYRDKYVALLESQVNSQKNILINQALLMTLQDVAGRILEKLEKRSAIELTDELRKLTEENLKRVGIL